MKHHKHFEVLEQVLIYNVMWYSVQVSGEVLEWLYLTFKPSVDFVYVRQLKGVWVNVSPTTLVLLKLKWS